MIFAIFRAKMIKLSRNCFSMQVRIGISYAIDGSTRSFTSLSGGNQVDGLPPAFNFGPMYNLSVLFLRFLCSGKFILAIIIFGRFFTYIKRVL